MSATKGALRIEQLARLFEPGQVTELRAIKVKRRFGRPCTVAGFFDTNHLSELAKAAEELTPNASGVYFVLNPLDTSLLARRANRTDVADTGELASDLNVLKRRWLLIDVDPIRDAHISATDEEKKLAFQLIEIIRTHLRSRGWPDPIHCDSGNGYHLLYRIDLPADDGGIVERILNALAKQFNNAHAHIDTSVFNQSRICKLPGTCARKGDHTPDRPHRQARFLDIPDQLIPVQREGLESLAAECKEDGDCGKGTGKAKSKAKSKTKSKPTPSQNGEFKHRLKVDAWLTDRHIEFRKNPGTDSKGREVYSLKACPFNPAHAFEAAVMQWPDGKLNAECFHDSCTGGWQEFKEAIGPPDPHHYDPPLKASSGAIMIGADEYRVNDLVCGQLHVDEEIFQQNNRLVHIVTEPENDGQALSPRIESIPLPMLRDKITAVASFEKVNAKGEVIPAHPPEWCVQAVAVRGVWPRVRCLDGVISFPIIRNDGSVLSTPGYDRASRLYLHWPGEPLEFPDRPTIDDARQALKLLFDVVSDFPFQKPIHRSAWLACLLTPLARSMFSGPAPLFLVDANVRSAGKGKLLDVVGMIVLGSRMPIKTYPVEEKELCKLITACLIAGDRLVLFDNLTGQLGNGTLDALLTGTIWRDRILGENRIFVGPINATWFTTGNNASIGADTARRICHIKLESDLERPEDRDGFKHPDLLAHVEQNRRRLLSSALTILRAFHVAGRPDQKLKPWGSYEVWVGQPDPGETRQVVQDQADTGAVLMRAFLSALESVDPRREGKTAAEIIRMITPRTKDTQFTEAEQTLHDVVSELIHKVDVRTLGYKLRQMRRRNFSGKFLDHRGGQNHDKVIRWAVFAAEQFHEEQQASAGDAGNAGDVFGCLSYEISPDECPAYKM